jgi:hypothetical protein
MKQKKSVTQLQPSRWLEPELLFNPRRSCIVVHAVSTEEVANFLNPNLTYPI